VDTLTAAPRVRRPVISLWLLRLVLTGHLLAVLGQPVLAGLYLTGDVDAIEAHGTIGSLLAAVGLVTATVALAYVVGGRGRWWVLPVAVALFLVDGFQIGMGYARIMQLHVPLGVAIAVVSVLLTAWAWTPSAARPRGARR
jgi:hypothetical protein